MLINLPEKGKRQFCPIYIYMCVLISRAVWFLTYPIILYILILIIIESLFKNEKEKSIDRSGIKRIFVLNRLVPHRKFAFFFRYIKYHKHQQIHFDKNQWTSGKCVIKIKWYVGKANLKFSYCKSFRYKNKKLQSIMSSL